MFQTDGAASSFVFFYNDTFIVLVSLALSSKFEQIKQRLEVNVAKCNSLVFWKEIRQDYVRLCYLCDAVNEHVLFNILLSFTTSLGFVLLTVFHYVAYVFVSWTKAIK